NLEFEAADTEMHQDQGNKSSHIDDQPDNEAASKHDCKPLPLIEDQGRQVVHADYFINNDLKNLKGGSSSSKYATSTIRTKATKNDNIEGIEDMVPRLWSPYDLGVALQMFTKCIVILHRFDILPKSLSCSLTCKTILPPWKQARKIYCWDQTSGIKACEELLKRRIYRSDLKHFITNSKEKSNLIFLSKMSDHEDETITEENAPHKVIPQITTVTNISTKFLYIKKGEYDIWAMKMQNFISSSDLLCWNIVLKGNSAKSTTTDNDGNLKIRPPVTAEEHQQVQREEKARTILLSALPNEHMGDFYHIIDARDIWNAIKARFGGNAESKKMQKSLLKQKFKEFKISEEEGLDNSYDKMQKILTQMNTLKIKPKPEDVNMKFLRGLPLLGNLSYQESRNGGYTSTLSASPSSSSSKGSSKSKCSVVDDVIYSFVANLEIDQHLVYEDLDQMNKEEFKEYDLKHQ
nr:ribonuclease H-like domain-containing protein [Tanacetum cinerariifolium]